MSQPGGFGLLQCDPSILASPPLIMGTLSPFGPHAVAGSLMTLISMNVLSQVTSEFLL